MIFNWQEINETSKFHLSCRLIEGYAEGGTGFALWVEDGTKLPPSYLTASVVKPSGGSQQTELVEENSEVICVRCHRDLLPPESDAVTSRGALLLLRDVEATVNAETDHGKVLQFEARGGVEPLPLVPPNRYVKTLRTRLEKVRLGKKKFRRKLNLKKIIFADGKRPEGSFGNSGGRSPS